MSLPYHRNQMSRNSNYIFGTQDQKAKEATRNMYEDENNKQWGELNEQVELLKALSKDINEEVKSQNEFLKGMGNQFNSVSNFFNSTMNKLNIMTNTNSSKNMYYLAAFVVFVFLVIYFMMKRK